MTTSSQADLKLDKVVPPLPSVTPGVPLALGADPNGTFLLYTNRNSVILRNLKDLSRNDVCVQHAKNVNVAKFSPSGFYIASADELGKVVIWDTVNPEHIVRNEFTPFSGPINDLEWTHDNKRIIVGGKGRSQCAGVYNSETGSSISALPGISAVVKSVDVRPTAPPRAITGDSEGLVSYFEGTSYKFKSHIQTHQKDVNAVRFSPTGTLFVSGGADKKIFLYNAEDGSTLCELGNPAHVGGVYGIAFSKTGSRFVSASADKSLKLWAVEGQNATFLFQYQLPDVKTNMFLGCAWVGDTVAAVTVDGSIHLFDAPEDAVKLKPRLVLFGHTGTVTCAAYTNEQDQLITGASDATLASWNLSDGLATRFPKDSGHTGAISGMALAGVHLLTVGLDDRCVLSNVVDRSVISSLKLPSQPHSLGLMPARMSVVVGCDGHVALLSALNNTLSMVDQHPIALGKNQLTVSSRTGTAIVCCQNEQLVAFKVCNGKLIKTHLVNPPPRPASLAAYSPDGSMIAFVDTARAITLHTIEDLDDPHHLPVLTLANSEVWQRHSGRVTAIAWSPDGKRIATGGLDNNIMVWSLTAPKNVAVFNGLKTFCISISWIDNSSFCTVSPDGCIRCWKVTNR